MKLSKHIPDKLIEFAIQIANSINSKKCAYNQLSPHCWSVLPDEMHNFWSSKRWLSMTIGFIATFREASQRAVASRTLSVHIIIISTLGLRPPASCWSIIRPWSASRQAELLLLEFGANESIEYNIYKYKKFLKYYLRLWFWNILIIYLNTCFSEVEKSIFEIVPLHSILPKINVK